MAVCYACAKQIRAGARFCSHCGQSQEVVICPGCGKANQKQARHCNRCGKILAQSCAACGHANKLSARFCHKCGTPVNLCPHCGAMNRPGARFCRSCGADPTNLFPQAAPVGLVAHRYRIVRQLAKGGMGIVYEVTDEREGGTWALKEMSVDAIKPDEVQEAIAAFRREAVFLQSLDHPNIVRVKDSFSVNNREFLVMELVEGDTLEALAADGKIDEADALRIAFQLCDALEYLHKQTPPIIYRDLKPSNAMLDATSGMVKLIDFGIARHYKQGQGTDTQILGTPGFAPPEQYGKGQTDARSDIFSLGVTLHVLLTGYDADQNPLNYPPVSKLNPNVTRRLEQVITRAVDLDMQKRYQSAADMRTALLQCKGAKKIYQNLPQPQNVRPPQAKRTPVASLSGAATPASAPAVARPAGSTPGSAPMPAAPVPPPVQPGAAPTPSTTQPGSSSSSNLVSNPASNPPLNPLKPALQVQVDKSALELTAGTRRMDHAELRISSNGNVQVEIVADQPWLEVTPDRFAGNEATVTVKVVALPDGVDLWADRVALQTERETPPVLERAWRWAEKRGASGKLWKEPDAAARTVLIGVPAVAAGTVGQFLAWWFYRHVNVLVPGEIMLNGSVEVRHAGGTQAIPVRVRVLPTLARRVVGWAGAGAAVTGEALVLAALLFGL